MRFRYDTDAFTMRESQYRVHANIIVGVVSNDDARDPFQNFARLQTRSCKARWATIPAAENRVKDH